MFQAMAQSAEHARDYIKSIVDNMEQARDTARAAIDSGMRCAVGLIVVEFPSTYAN